MCIRDRREHVSEPVAAKLRVVPSLTPKLDLIELSGPQRMTGKVHPNDWLSVHGDGFLFGEGEGDTVALLSGCFLPEGTSEPCSVNGRAVREVELPVQPQSRFDRTSAIFPYSPTIHGVMPGKFSGTLRLRNQPPGSAARTLSSSRTISVEQVRPELKGISPSAASLGQYVEMQGAGFIGGQAGQATLVRLQGQFSLEGSPVMIPVSYTHLDVYKRQALYSQRTSCSFSIDQAAFCNQQGSQRLSAAVEPGFDGADRCLDDGCNLFVAHPLDIGQYQHAAVRLGDLTERAPKLGLLLVSQ